MTNSERRQLRKLDLVMQQNLMLLRGSYVQANLHRGLTPDPEFLKEVDILVEYYRGLVSAKPKKA